jgi:Ribosome-associated heat shock protein implicated in the recycling of the 50S subunit (S4 paralog)
MPAPKDHHTEPCVARVRIDKWLWAARFYKTRALAVHAIEAGQVRLDEERIKSSRIVKIGDALTIRKDGLTWKITIKVLAEKRVSAQLAAAFYEESDASRSERELMIAQRQAATKPRFPGRPTKRDRRALEDFLNEG